MERKLIGNIGKKYINVEENIDVRTSLPQAFRVGASVQEACNYAGVPLAVYNDWEYTYEELNIIKEYMYANKLNNYTDIDIDKYSKENGYSLDSNNIVLLTRVKKNPSFGDDIYKLISKCKKAQAEIVIYHLGNIYQQKKTNKNIDWRASAWFLERTNPARYGRKDADNAIENDVNIKTTKITVEYVDPKTSSDRVREMEQIVREEIEGKKK